MKIRLMGTSDLIQQWAKELERAYGITGKTYPSRNSHEIRYYVDLDDRKAEAIVSQKTTASTSTAITKRTTG